MTQPTRSIFNSLPREVLKLVLAQSDLRDVEALACTHRYLSIAANTFRTQSDAGRWKVMKEKTYKDLSPEQILLQAIEKSDAEEVKLVTTYSDVDLNETYTFPDSEKIMTPLIATISTTNDFAIANILIGRGADVNVKLGSYTALFYAVNQQNIDKVRLLEKHGADFNVIVKGPGKNLLHYASKGTELYNLIASKKGIDPSLMSVWKEKAGDGTLGSYNLALFS